MGTWFCICTNCGTRHKGDLVMECTQCGDTKFMSHLLRDGEEYKEEVTDVGVAQVAPMHKVRRK
jgi:hypothetical protein